LWAALTEQSRGSLHVFLPLADRGVDALVHRLSDGKYFEVQAKSRSSLMDGEVHLVVWAESLVHDELLIVAGLIVEGGLGPTVLVVPASDFKRLANLSSNNGVPVYSMEFGMRPRSDSRWLRWLVPAETGDLNLFRPFPDSETAELAVLHLNTRSVVGLQVKTVDVDERRMHATVNIYGASFRPAQSTYLVVLAWLRDHARFHDDCLLIPSVEVSDIAHSDGYGHLTFDWLPRSATPDPFAKYRVSINDLRARVTGLVAS
jgi:hypothetical protein